MGNFPTPAGVRAIYGANPDMHPWPGTQQGVRELLGSTKPQSSTPPATARSTIMRNEGAAPAPGPEAAFKDLADLTPVMRAF